MQGKQPQQRDSFGIDQTKLEADLRMVFLRSFDTINFFTPIDNSQNARNNTKNPHTKSNKGLINLSKSDDR
jgi:hypothetical protein